MTTDDAAALFLPHLVNAAAPIRAGKRLVHYTSAEAAYRIISGKQVWLRNSHLMNDYSEIRHGLNCLQAAWASPEGERLKLWLDTLAPNMQSKVEDLFNAHADGLTSSTFIMSLSQHEDEEDNFGRLSMWRAYGGKSGVALVLNPTVFLSETDQMSVFSTPVNYRSVEDFTSWFSGWVDGLISAGTALKEVDIETISSLIFYAFRTFVLATKHPAFHEEKEWRVFHSPLLDGSSDWLDYGVEIISGVPQHIVKVKLLDDVERGVTGVAPSTLINRVIVGPCENPLPVRNALAFALTEAGVADVGEKIWMSFIPIRQ